MSFAIDQTTNKKRSRGLSQAMLKFGCIHMDLGNGTWIYILTYVCNAHSYDSFHIDLFLKMLITTWIFVLSSLFALIFWNKNKHSSKCFFSWFLTSVLYIYIFPYFQFVQSLCDWTRQSCIQNCIFSISLLPWSQTLVWDISLGKVVKWTTL